MPVPLRKAPPRSVQVIISSMINEGEPEHRRLRSLVSQAFTPRSIEHIGERVDRLTDELLDAVPKGEPFDLIAAMIERKRAAPEDDVLSALIAAEQAGDKLNHDELLAMVYLLIIAGYETTVHLITNAVLTLLQHPQQLAQLRASLDAGDELLDATIEEVLRYAGPVQGTKLQYPTQTIVIRDVEIPRGAMVLPCLGAANRDPNVWTDPDRFDIHREHHKHLGFGFGPHFCLGAALARLETKIALRKLLRRFANIELAVPVEQLELQALPLWMRYRALPLRVS